MEISVKHLGKEFSETINKVMKETADKYLACYSDNIRIKVDSHIGHSWTK